VFDKGINMKTILTNIQKQLLLTLAFTNILPVSFLHATSGILDTSFGNRGFMLTPISKADTLRSAIVNSSNKIIIGGTTQMFAQTLFLAQYTANGALDTASFNSGGATPGTQTLSVGSMCGASALALDSSSNIIAVGFTSQTQTNMLIARFTPSGALDTTFNSPNGYIAQSVGAGAMAYAVGLQSTGNIIVAGTSVNGGSPNFTLLRLTSSGTLDTTFGASGIVITHIGAIDILQAIAIQSDDKIVVLGSTDNQPTLMRYAASGSLDATFGTAGIFQPTIPGATSSQVYDVAIDSSGNILISGSANISGINQSLLLRCTSSGVLDTTFNSGGTPGYVLQSIAYGSEFYSLVIQSDTKIIGAGYALGALSDQLSIARYLATGVIDTTYGTSGVTLTSLGSVTAAQSIVLQSTGESIAAGLADGTFFVARYTA
jgi:uncharacterized delta-60 repeat protein